MLCVGSVMSDSLWPHGLKPTKLLCPWDSPGKNNGVDCRFLLQGSYWVDQNSPWGHNESDTTEWLSLLDFPCGLAGKESTCQCRRPGFDPWVGKTPQRRKWQPTPVFLPGKSHGQRSLVGFSPRGLKESDIASEQ